MRAIIFILILYCSVQITNAYSILTYPVDLNIRYTWPQMAILLLGFYYMKNKRKISHYYDDIHWCIPSAKFSIFISCFVLVATLPISGRDGKLEAISSNIILYYLNLINSGILMVMLCSLLQPVKVMLTKRTLFYFATALVFFSLTNLSRTMAFYFAIALLISNVKLNISKRKLFLFGGVLIFLMVSMPILQGRTDSLEGAVGRSFLNIIFYLSYSFGLGEHLINTGEYPGISWGYFGYALSKLLNEPLVSNVFFDQKILYEFVPLGVSEIYGTLNANVMYPLWSTIYSDYGDFSFLPYLFIILAMSFASRLRLNIIFGWLLFRFAALGFLISPILLRDVVIELFVVLFFQIYMIYYDNGRNKID